MSVDYFFCGYANYGGYTSRPTGLANSKEKLIATVTTLIPDMLLKLALNSHHIRLCYECEGGHIEM